MATPQRGLSAKSPKSAFATSRTNIPNYTDALWQPLYDYQNLPAAGASSQRFFIDPIGTGGKTVEDTNMELSGQIPKGQAFLITGVQVELYPGEAIQQDSVSQFADDIYDFYTNGALKLKIGSTDFITQGNLMKFPPVNRLGLDSSVSDTTADTVHSYLYASATGREYAIKDKLLESNQNFSVELIGLSAMPSGNDARVGVTLNGFLYRNAQV